MIRNLLVCFFLLVPLSALAGSIRTINMNADKMKTIHLRMGQSTILRFSDKPQKIVVGNQNYYSAEFIGNDVTIQPLGKFNTNLFVYTAHHVYGFLLRTSEYGRYDDLVNVRWKAVGMILEQKRRPLPTKEKSLNISLELGDLSVHIHRLIINKDRGSHIFDFTVHNKGAKSLKTSKLDIVLTRSNKRLLSQEFAFEKDQLGVDKTVRGRVLVRLKSKKGFTFNIHHGKKKKSKVISRRLL